MCCQEPVGPVAEGERPRLAARSAVRSSERRRTASRCSAGELRQGGLLRGERVQQFGLARLDPRDEPDRVRRSLAQGRLRRRHPRRLGLRLRAESRVRLLDAVEHDRAIHEVGEGVGSQQVRGRRAGPEHRRTPDAHDRSAGPAPPPPAPARRPVRAATPRVVPGDDRARDGRWPRPTPARGSAAESSAAGARVDDLPAELGAPAGAPPRSVAWLRRRSWRRRASTTPAATAAMRRPDPFHLPSCSPHVPHRPASADA